ncbi:urokinase plasminogen activator surface receptor-like [Podarcis raffonei]|uniref:urokinase plasminogen activator surface receptor-like n=1 Tax=Podarcis raffonei TaxID=65483 RepID=UPI0023295E35|nr:urokinase plasminogen activator surface receptor-like [Podarcis raffonei]
MLEQKTPWWLSLQEAISLKKTNAKSEWATYKELLMEIEQQLKLKRFEDTRHLVTDWLQYHQFNDVFNIDKKNGFSKEISRFAKDLLECNVKLLSKMYKLLLEWHTKDEEVKSNDEGTPERKPPLGPAFSSQPNDYGKLTGPQRNNTLAYSLPLNCRYTYNKTGMTNNGYGKTTCDSKEDSCVASVLRRNISKFSSQLLNKCTSSDNCFSGNYSFTAGDGKFFEMKKHCCNTELCKNAILSRRFLADNSVLTENGLKCPACFSKGTAECESEKTIDCLGNETQCVVFKGALHIAFARLHHFTFQGCGTTDFCAIPENRRTLGSGEFGLFITQKRCYTASGISHQPEHEG